MTTNVFPFVESCQPYTVTLTPGTYIFELWGASGGATSVKGGNGAFVSAVLKLKNKQTFQVHVGGKGEDGSKNFSRTNSSCNGGASGGKPSDSIYYSGGAGGGATDVRLNDSIDSRILVASGGGGAGHAAQGGDGGALESSPVRNSKGATQTDGFSKGAGQPGRDATPASGGSEGNGGGGGGYFGGFSCQETGVNTAAGGTGGSSFISGYKKNNYVSHYSFTNPIMLSGSQTVKYKENGYAIITRLENIFITCKINVGIRNNILFMILISK